MVWHGPHPLLCRRFDQRERYNLGGTQNNAALVPGREELSNNLMAGAGQGYVSITGIFSPEELPEKGME
jgi:hypothetical protein